MSIVKLHLPFYNDKVLLKIISVMNDRCEIVCQDIHDLGAKSSHELYEKIGQLIFELDSSIQLILLGDSGKLQLSIPESSRFVIKSSSDKIKPYLSMGYKPISERSLLTTLEDKLDHESIHHAGMQMKDGKILMFDVYKLWYLTNDIKPIKFEVTDVLEQVFGTSDYKSLKNLPLWEDITLANIKKHPEHYKRVKNADLSCPILMIIHNKTPTLVDGLHRLIGAFMMKEKFIKVKMIPKKVFLKGKV